MHPLPLLQKRIVVTRARAQAGEFVSALEVLGAEVLELPTIAIEDPTNPAPLIEGARTASQFDLIVFTSVNGVLRFWQALRKTGQDSRSIAHVSLSAIGEATAREIEREGAKADLIPEEYVAESLVDALASHRDLSGLKILLPRAENARPLLRLQLEKFGAVVADVPAYRTVPAGPVSPDALSKIHAGAVDVVTFTSSSAARYFAEHVATDVGGAQVASIGPITSATIRELGWSVAIEAEPHTTAGLAAAIVEFFSPGFLHSE